MTDYKQIINILGTKYTIDLLIAICEKPGESKTYYMNLTKGHERTKFLRIGDLEKNELVEIIRGHRQHNTFEVHPTKIGKRVYAALNMIAKGDKKMVEQDKGFESVREALVNRLLSNYGTDILAAETNYDRYVKEILEDLESYLVKTKYHTLADIEDEIGAW